MRNQNAFMNVVVRRFAGAARRLDPRPSEFLPSSPSIRGDAAAAPPAFRSAALSVRQDAVTQSEGRATVSSPRRWDWCANPLRRRAEDSRPYLNSMAVQEDCANERAGFLTGGVGKAFRDLAARVVAALALFLVSLSSHAAVRAVG